MFRRLAVILTAFLVTFLVGCSFLTTSTTTLSYSTLTTTSGETVTNIENPVSYETLFDNTNYHKFIVSFSKANFDKLVNDMQNYFDEFGTYRDNTIQEVDIYYEDGYGNKVTLNEVGFRTKGNIFSRVLPVILDQQGNVIGYQQVSFQLEFNETFLYPDASTQYKALKDRRMFDLEQLNFKMIRSGDTGIVTEMIAYDLYRAAGVIAPNTSLAVIYFDIEGEEALIPYGLFTVTEPIDDVFVKRYFGRNQDGSIGDLYKCVWQNFGPATLKTGYDPNALGISDYNDGYRKNYQLKTNKSTSNFSQFITFVNDLNNTSVINYKNKLESILDVDTWLKTLAMGYLVGNPDDYRSDANNYYLYFYEGQAVYIPFDNDQSLGYGWNPYGDYGLSHDIYNIPPAQQWINQNDLVLVNNVLAFPEYRLIYEQYLLAYTDPQNGLFNYDLFYQEFVIASTLYQTEILRYNHLGVKTFSLNSRSMTARDYFTQKIARARERANYYQNQ
jgi:spore coat protein CotH